MTEQQAPELTPQQRVLRKWPEAETYWLKGKCVIWSDSKGFLCRPQDSALEAWTAAAHLIDEGEE